ncbi:Hypothetical protein CCH01_003630 [Clostridium chauvoei JF4335]|nr:Hypothetical protein CCH01_003630 [Clostridium chauvoei JF4335]
MTVEKRSVIIIKNLQTGDNIMNIKRVLNNSKLNNNFFFSFFR